jgi:hypothetical protein
MEGGYAHYARTTISVVESSAIGVTSKSQKMTSMENQSTSSRNLAAPLVQVEATQLFMTQVLHSVIISVPNAKTKRISFPQIVCNP